MSTPTYTVATLAWDRSEYHPSHNWGIGVRARHRRFLEKAGVIIQPITPNTPWDPGQGPIVVARGDETLPLISTFLLRHPEYQHRYHFDCLLLQSFQPRREVASDNLARFNAVLWQGNTLDPEFMYQLKSILRCPHRSRIVAHITSLQQKALARTVIRVFPLYPRQSYPLRYRNEIYRQAFERLGIITCDGCIGTASRLLFVAVARYLGYINYSINDVWRRDRGIYRVAPESEQTCVVV